LNGARFDEAFFRSIPEYSGVYFLAAGFFIISAKDFHPDCRARFSSVAQVNQLVS
jgi:hypothetical protein